MTGAENVILCALFFALGGCAFPTAADKPAADIRTPMPGNWGIDACLTAHVPIEGRNDYLKLLQGSGITWLRERSPNLGMAELKTGGYNVVSFLGDLRTERPRVGDALPEDLLAVFNGARDLAKSSEAKNIDVWEMVGEPDVGYCPDLPDRLAAFQKAVYLGLKAGATDDRRRRAEDGVRKAETAVVPQISASGAQLLNARAPLVLMGALALPPGPWLERAKKNGLLEYTDAYNFHFYGRAEDLSGVIAAHARVARRSLSGDRRQITEDGWPSNTKYPSIIGSLFSFVRRPLSLFRSSATGLPLWITECGVNTVTSADFENPERRKAQAAFTLSTAKQALAAKNVAMFMPFIFVHQGDSHALTLASDKPLPAWDTYSKFTREHPWPQRALSAPSEVPNPIVVQWLPSVGAAVPHKVSGTYRFWRRQPMHGDIYIYNFSDQPMRGNLLSAIPPEFEGVLSSTLTGLTELTIPALGRVTVPVSFVAPETGYARGECNFCFTDSAGRQTNACFGLETWPEVNDFSESPLELHPLLNREIRFPEFPLYERGDVSGPWQTINGLHVAAADDGLGNYFWTDRQSLDPLMPAMAFSAVDGVPADGFLHLQMDRPMALGRTVRVDLVDADGQRFCIWENLGQSYFINSTDVWLNVRDMQVYFWGRCTASPVFRPERVKEIQLWFYRKNPAERMRVRLSWMTPTRASQ